MIWLALIGIGIAVMIGCVVGFLDRRFYGPGIWPKPTGERRVSDLVYGVTLVKKDRGFGPLPKGDTFRAVFRHGYAPDEAVRRAFRILGRDHPDENPMAWEPRAENGQAKP